MSMSKIAKFNKAFDQFLNERNAALHHKAIEVILREAGLLDEFNEILKQKDGIQKFFLLWEYAGKVERNRKERRGLKKMGELSKKFYESKDYSHLCELFFDIAFRHFAEYVKLRERDDFMNLTDHDLYNNDLIPPDIFLQYFIIETITKRKDLGWNRGEIIVDQNLACFIVCWNDIYAFFNESAE